MKQSSALFFLGAILVGLFGCSGLSGPQLSTAPVAGGVVAESHPLSVGLLPEDYPNQRILRVRYQGEQDGGSFRAILWVVGPEQFKLRAVDPLGRALWGLALQGESVHLVNYRDKTECRASGSVVISSVVLENLPIGELPVVLSGRLPASLRLAQTTADGRLVDESGQKWSVVQDGSEILKWTLWGYNGPLLWFQRVDNGGI